MAKQVFGVVVAALVAALSLFAGCAQPPAAGPGTPSAEQILTACMKVEVPAALRRVGVDPKVRDRDDAGALAFLVCNEVVKRCAATPESEACMKVLAGYGLGAPDYKPPAGAALFDAAYAGNTDLVRRLVAEGVDVNWRNAGGWTPLMIAAAERHLDTVNVLLDAKADPNQRNAYGRTALMFASRYGKVKIVERLLAAGADPNIVPTDATGITALGAAAIEGHVAVIQLLLDKGADPSIRSRSGQTPLDLARANGRSQAVRLLEAAGRAGG
jgi:hypothetical protein